MLNFDQLEFRDKFNRTQFTFGHDLAEHPEFAVPRLIELAKSTAEPAPADVYYDVGAVDIGQRLGDDPQGPLPIDETIRRIETEGAWIILWRAELDPVYGRLLAKVMSDVTAMTGSDLERNIKKKEIIIFITSPNRVTTYHIDRECNFLLQINGNKEISIFARDDREVLPEVEIERFWTVDNNAPIYRRHLQHRADVLTLEPGNGVHIPINAPHWLKNGNNISVTASFNFQFRDSIRANLTAPTTIYENLACDRGRHSLRRWRILSSNRSVLRPTRLASSIGGLDHGTERQRRWPSAMIAAELPGRSLPPPSAMPAPPHPSDARQRTTVNSRKQSPKLALG